MRITFTSSLIALIIAMCIIPAALFFNQSTKNIEPTGNELYLGRVERVSYVHQISLYGGDCVKTILDVNDIRYMGTGKIDIPGTNSASILKGKSSEGDNYLRVVGDENYEAIMFIDEEWEKQ